MPPGTRPVYPGAAPVLVARKQPGLGLLVVNLGLLVCAGVAASFWTHYYTDWFPVVGSLLGLGGLFAWVAFLANLVSDERKKQMQAGFEQKYLLRHWPWVTIVVAAMLLAVYSSRRGTLLVDSVAESGQKWIEIRPAGSGSQEVADRFVLGSGAESKRVLATDFRGSREYRVKVAGLPSAIVTVHAFRRQPLSIPQDLLRRPLVLVRPMPVLTANAAREPGQYEAVVSVNGVPAPAVTPYGGGTIWVGAEDDVPFGAETRERWRLELIAAGGAAAGDAVVRWLEPKAVHEATILKAGDHVDVVVRQRGGAVEYWKPLVVGEVSRAGRIQEVRPDVS
jgi:hypothetical protein